MYGGVEVGGNDSYYGAITIVLRRHRQSSIVNRHSRHLRLRAHGIIYLGVLTMEMDGVACLTPNSTWSLSPPRGEIERSHTSTTSTWRSFTTRPRRQTDESQKFKVQVQVTPDRQNLSPFHKNGAKLARKPTQHYNTAQQQASKGKRT